MVIKPGSITMVATDGHRLAHIEKTEAFEDVTEEIRVLVPKKAMAELVKMISEGGEADKIGFSRDDNHLFFDMGKRLLVARMLTGQFPNFEAVLPQKQRSNFHDRSRRDDSGHPARRDTFGRTIANRQALVGKGNSGSYGQSLGSWRSPRNHGGRLRQGRAPGRIQLPISS